MTHWHADAAPHLSLWVCTTSAAAAVSKQGPWADRLPTNKMLSNSLLKPSRLNSLGNLLLLNRPNTAHRMEKFTAEVGRAPLMPRWTSGYWQSKNRYRNQSEVLEVVRGHRARRLPLAMIVIGEVAGCSVFP